ncbi:MAG: hypothetical protein IKS39_07600, partial [Clostridia bacterium]|nr:hypothetical protein [Clostridia bacterium]
MLEIKVNTLLAGIVIDEKELLNNPKNLRVEGSFSVWAFLQYERVYSPIRVIPSPTITVFIAS